MIPKQLMRVFYLFIVLLAGAAAGMWFFLRQPPAETAPQVVPIPQKAQYQIGLLQSDQTPEEDRMRKGFLDALAAQGYKDGEKIKVEFISAGGDQALLEKGARSFAGGQKDLVGAIGDEAGAAMGRFAYSTPVVGMGILNFKERPWLSGHENVTGMNSIPGILTQLSTAKRLVKAQRVGILYSEKDVDSIMQLDWLRSAAARKNITLYEVMVKETEKPEDRAKAFPGQVDSVYIAEDQRILKNFKKVMKVLDAAKIPVIGADEQMVRKGALISVSEDYYRMGFSAGRMAAKLLKGGIVPEEIPIGRQRDADLVINMAQVKRLGIALPNDLWQKARKLYLYDGQPARS